MKCKWCNKKGTPKTIEVLGIKKQVICFECDCFDKDEKRREQESLRKHLDNKLNNSLIAKRFINVSFETIDKNNHYETCLNYANNFTKDTEHGFIFYGNIGTGKTTLSVAICKKLIERGYKPLMINMISLIDKFNECYSNGDVSRKKVLGWLLGYDFIVIDDMAKETYTDARKSNAFEIFNELYKECKPVCITGTKKSLIKLKRIDEFEDIFDRLHQTCTQLEFIGNSRRRKEGD